MNEAFSFIKTLSQEWVVPPFDKHMAIIPSVAVANRIWPSI